jgi:lipoate-protein ligase A
VKRPSNRVIALVASGVVVAGVGAGFGVAASGGSDKSPAAGLAEALNKNKGTNLTEADVRQAMLDAYKARLDEAVAAGRITQAEADERLQRAKDAPQRAAEHRARKEAALAPVAKLLGMTAEQIHDKRHEGVSLAELAKEKNIDRAKLIAAIKEGLSAAAKSAGQTPTDSELTTRAERIADAEGGRGGFGRGGGRHGGPGGFGFGPGFGG